MRANLAILILALALVFPAARAQAADPIYTGIFSSTALGGYDAVVTFAKPGRLPSPQAA